MSSPPPPAFVRLFLFGLWLWLRIADFRIAVLFLNRGGLVFGTHFRRHGRFSRPWRVR
jgi:hypothetical protein